MKKKDLLLNIVLVFLLILTIVQASLLWIKFPDIHEKKNIQEVYNTEDFFKEILKPEKVVLNTGQNHYIKYNFPEIWNEYSNILSQIFINTEEKDLIPVNYTEYLEAQKEKSLVFVFNKEINGRLFLNLTGDKRQSKNKYNLEMKEIYLSRYNVFIVNSKGAFKLNFNITANPEDTINKTDLSKLEPFINLYEAYGVQNNIYIPLSGRIRYQEISYQDEIKNLDKLYENNLASRVLNQNIDYVKEITQKDGTTFVYGDKFFKIMNNGLIYYENPESIDSIESNLYLSMKTAISFMSSKMGVPNTIRLYNFEPIKDSKNSFGYRFYFNFTESNIPVYLNSSISSNYIIIDVYSDIIKSYRQIYRGPVEKPEKIYHESTHIDLKNLITEHYSLFDNSGENPDVMNVMQKINNINFCYIDNNDSDDKSKLIPALNIKYNNRNLFFNLKNSTFIMER